MHTHDDTVIDAVFRTMPQVVFLEQFHRPTGLPKLPLRNIATMFQLLQEGAQRILVRQPRIAARPC